MGAPKKRRASGASDQTETSVVENDSVQPTNEENIQTAEFAAEVAAQAAAAGSK